MEVQYSLRALINEISALYNMHEQQLETVAYFLLKIAYVPGSDILDTPTNTSEILYHVG